MPSWKSLIIDMNFGGHPKRSRTVHRASLLTVSKALVKSVKTENRDMFCSMHFSWSCLMAKIMSTVLFPGLKRHCASGRFCSATVRSLLRIRTSPVVSNQTERVGGASHGQSKVESLDPQSCCHLRGSSTPETHCYQRKTPQGSVSSDHHN